MTFLRRHLTFLRLVLVALVMCGLLVQPTLAALSDLHAFEHAAAVDGDHGHEHGHGHDHDSAHPPSTLAGGDLPDDVSGLHGLLHSCVAMNAAALFDVPFFEGACPKGSDPPLAMPESGHISLHASSPFRPPIV